MVTFPRVKREFGIEIECCSKKDYYGIKNDLNGVIPDLIDSFHNLRNYEKWGIKSDGSIRVTATHQHNIEIASRILSGKSGLLEIEKVLNRLNSYAMVNESCGLHVTFNTRDLTKKQVANIGFAYAYFERVINLFVHKTRVGNSYCRTLTKSYAGIKELSNGEFNRVCDKFTKVNFGKFNCHKVLEFRQHHGSLSFTEISHWIVFLLKFIETMKDYDVKKLLNTKWSTLKKVKLLLKLIKFETGYTHFLSQITQYRDTYPKTILPRRWEKKMTEESHGQS